MTVIEHKKIQEHHGVSIGAGLAIAGMWLAAAFLTAVGVVALLILNKDNISAMSLSMKSFGTIITASAVILWLAAGFFTAIILADD